MQLGYQRATNRAFDKALDNRATLLSPDYGPDYNDVVFPQLRPLEGDSLLESYNRDYCMLKYFQYVATSKHRTARFESPDRRKNAELRAEMARGHDVNVFAMPVMIDSDFSWWSK